MSSFTMDLRYAIRMLRSYPGYTLVAVLTLAIGIGVNVGIFSFVDGILLKPLPYPEADRIVRVLEKPPQGERNGISTLNYLDWKRDNTVFEFMAAQTGAAMTLTGGAEPVQLRAGRAGVEYFRIFGIQPALGRGFVAGEDEFGRHRVVLLTNALWESRFGADPAMVGRTIQLNNQPYTVVGVLPKDSAFDRAANEIWVPLAFEPSNMTRDFHWMGSFARLKPGVTLAQAQAAMNVIGTRIAAEYPASNKGWGVIVERYADTLVGTTLRTALLVLMTATGLVLLIGCANLANLALARGIAREREVVVRASIGAGRWQLIRQFLIENIVLSLCGGALGLVVAYATIRGIRLMLPPFAFAREAVIALDVRALGFAAAVSMASGVLFGIIPALQAARPDLAASMKEDTRMSGGGGSRRRLRDGLIVAEVALAFVLVVGAGLMMRSFVALMNVDTGFEASNLLTMRLPIATEAFADATQLNRYLREMRTAVEAVPGVRQAAYSCAPPMQGTCYGMPMQVANRPMVDRANRSGGFFKVVSPSYFSTLGIRVIKGRGLSDLDTWSAPRALVINQRLANRFFPNEDPIGQQILIQEIMPGKTELGAEVSWQVVGLIGDEKIAGPDDEQSAGVYVSNEQSPVYGMVLTVRSVVDAATLQKPIADAIHRLSKDQAISDVRTVDQIKNQAMGPRRVQSVLLGLFGTVALILSGIGIYGVISYSVAQRTREIGIRSALGATRQSLLTLVINRGVLLTVAGLVIGVAGAVGLTRLMTSLLFGVGARDPMTMVLAGAVLAVVAVIASYVPARRAANLDPVVALREQ